MRAARAWLLGAALMAGASATWTTHAQVVGEQRTADARPHFKTAVNLTTVTATVVDAAGRLVPRLPLEAFELFEDGVPQTITQFTNERVPVSLGILLDGSDSMYGRRISDARSAIYRFLSDLLDPADEYSLVVFNHQQRLLSEWTDDRSVAFDKLHPVRPWGSTAIYDAVAAAIPMAQTRHRQRAALLVLSDGADTASDVTLRDLRRELLRSDFFVYAIGIDSPDRRAINAAVNAAALAEVTDQSGGRTHVVHDMSEVAIALDRIAEELNSQYLIGYSSPRGDDGKYHSIRVRVRSGEYKVRARNGYIAAEPR
jgi:Ca-activated chloride channel family protein